MLGRRRLRLVSAGLAGLALALAVRGPVRADAPKAEEAGLRALRTLAAKLRDAADGELLARELGTVEHEARLGNARRLLRVRPAASLAVLSAVDIVELGFVERPGLDGPARPEMLGVNFRWGQGPTLGLLRRAALASRDRLWLPADKAARKKAPNRGAVTFVLDGAVVDLDLADLAVWHHAEAKRSPLAVTQVRLYTVEAAAREGILPNGAAPDANAAKPREGEGP